MSFKISRSDGRSDSEVILDIVNAASPGDILEYKVLADALSVGTARKYKRTDVQSAICRSERKLATNASRALINVRGRGYKIALAAEHQKIAGAKKDRAGNLLKRGLRTLQNVRWDEMSVSARQAHEGQLMVTSAVAAAVEGIDQRLRQVEEAIANRK